MTLAIPLLTVLGLVAAWPLYLHLRKVKRKVQVIPSLRILSMYGKRRKKHNSQHILLMLTRIAMIALLALLISRPFVESKDYLPFPVLAGEKMMQDYFAVVLDDSVYSHRRIKGETRFSHYQKWLKKTLATLPDDTKVALLTTTMPMGASFMSAKQALERLALIKPSFGNGYAAEAVYEMRMLLKGRMGRMVVLASRENELWKNSSELNDELKFSFYDLSDADPEAWLKKVSFFNNNNQVRVVCNLDGDESAMVGQNIHITANNKDIFSYPLTASDIKTKRAILSLDRESLNGAAVLSLEDSASPWANHYFTAKAFEQGSREVMIVRPQNSSGMEADRLLSAVFTALMPDVKLYHKSLNQLKTADWPEGCRKVVCIGYGNCDSLVARKTADITGQVRLLYMPLSSEPNVWEKASVTRLLKLNFTQSFMRDYSHLPIKTLNAWSFKFFFPPVIQNSSEVLITLAGKPFCTQETSKRAENLKILRLGVLPLPSKNSDVIHPAFPFLVTSILSTQNQDLLEKDILVGRQVDLKAFFSTKEQGIIMAPGDRKVEIIDSSKAILDVPESPGFYYLPKGETDKALAVNIPVPGSIAMKSRGTLSKSLLADIKWLKVDDTVESVEKHNISGRGESIKYDLSLPVVLILIFILLFEEISLFLVWLKAGRSKGGELNVG